jgi:hypothetical protein
MTLGVPHEGYQVPAFETLAVAVDVDAKLIGDALRMAAISHELCLQDDPRLLEKKVHPLRRAGASWRPFLAANIQKYTPKNREQQILEVILILDDKRWT